MFNLDELGLVAEFWAFVCLLICLDCVLCGFSSTFAEIAVSRSNLDYPFFHGRTTGEAVLAFWAHPVWPAGFPCALQGLFDCFPFFLSFFLFFFPLFLMGNSELGSRLQSANKPVMRRLVYRVYILLR